MADTETEGSAPATAAAEGNAEMSQDEAIQKLSDMMQERGFAKDKDLSELASASYKLGYQGAVMHESCAAPDCAVCSVRNDIQDKAFKRGLEKGAALVNKLGGAQQIAA